MPLIIVIGLSQDYYILGIHSESSQRYKYKSYISKGAFGEVFSCIDTETNLIVAIKKLTANTNANRAELQCILTEVRVLKFVNHDNICKAHRVILAHKEDGCRRNIYIVQDYYPLDLHNLIYKNKKHKLTSKELKIYAYQLMRGVEYLHSVDILHLDLRPANILINPTKGSLKICDFGLARMPGIHAHIYNSNSYLDYKETRWYRPPECLASKLPNYTRAVDVWSIALIIIEIIIRKPLFKGNSNQEVLSEILNVLGKPNITQLRELNDPYMVSYINSYNINQIISNQLENILSGENEMLIDLLQQMLQFSPKERIDLTTALEHPYFHEINHLPIERNFQPFDWRPIQNIQLKNELFKYIVS